jgi:butyryl-CoA dehydrogenase
MNTLYQGLGDSKYRPCPLLRQYVEAGWLGRKSGKGFYRALMYDRLGELGLTGIVFPEEYGGAGADYISYAIAVEELSRVCGSTGVTLSAHLSLCANPIYMFGTEEQKQKFLCRWPKVRNSGPSA